MAKRTTCLRPGRGRLPKWSAKKGWSGGDAQTLYVFFDPQIESGFVAPPSSAAGAGPEVEVRVATRAEAEGRVKRIEGWQTPLHAGWKVACDD